MEFGKNENVSFEETMREGQEVLKNIENMDCKDDIAMLIFTQLYTLKTADFTAVTMFMEPEILKYIKIDDMRNIARKLHEILLAYLELHHELEISAKNIDINEIKKSNRNIEKDDVIDALNYFLTKLKDEESKD